MLGPALQSHRSRLDLVVSVMNPISAALPPPCPRHSGWMQSIPFPITRRRVPETPLPGSGGPVCQPVLQRLIHVLTGGSRIESPDTFPYASSYVGVGVGAPSGNRRECGQRSECGRGRRAMWRLSYGVDSGDGVACGSDVAVAGSSIGKGSEIPQTVAVGRCSPQPTATATASIQEDCCTRSSQPLPWHHHSCSPSPRAMDIGSTQQIISEPLLAPPGTVGRPLIVFRRKSVVFQHVINHSLHVMSVGVSNLPTDPVVIQHIGQ